MNYIFYPEKDATIYEDSSLLNSGLDQILEVGTFDSYSNRALIKFNTDLINEYITENNVTDYSASLKLYTVESRNIPLDFNLEFLPISESWNNGTGKTQHNPITKNGVSWKNKSENISWSTGSALSTSSFYKVTGGGNWYNNYLITQSFNYNTVDVSVDIKPYLLDWIDETIKNEGIIIKFDDLTERNTTTNLGINFFSNETNTIFVPRIVFSYDDSVYETGSLEIIPNIKDIQLHPKIKQNYYHGENVKIDILVRDKFPKPRFSATSSYLFGYRLPETSYYSIIDNSSKNVILDFSEHTKISHKDNINFFNLNVDFLFPKRSYLIKFKIVTENNIQYYTHKYPFFVFRS